MTVVTTSERKGNRSSQNNLGKERKIEVFPKSQKLKKKTKLSMVTYAVGGRGYVCS